MGWGGRVTYANYGSVPSQRRRWTEPETAGFGHAEPYGGNGGGYGGGGGGPDWMAPGPEQHDRVAAEIRNLVVDRLSQMNAQHALNAWGTGARPRSGRTRWRSSTSNRSTRATRRATSPRRRPGCSSTARTCRSCPSCSTRWSASAGAGWPAVTTSTR